MDKVWSWITTLPTSNDSPPSLLLLLATSANNSIFLQADRTACPSDAESLVTFSISLRGCHPSSSSKTLWLSNAYPLSSPTTHLLILIQLLQEVISLAPSRSYLGLYQSSTTPTLDFESISVAFDAAPDQSPAFFSLVLLCRLFWLCACDSPADAGFLFFTSLNPDISRALDCRKSMRAFLVAVGADWEEKFMRALGYMLAKWCIMRDLQAGPVLPLSCCPAYVAETHGLWVLRGYAPVQAMVRVGTASSTGGFEPKESVLRYALAHQQLEAVIQLEHTVCLRDPRFIRIGVRVENIRLHVVRLGFGNRKVEEGESEDVEREMHFPSRARIWVGPEIGSSYATCLSLGRSTGNPEKEVETTRTVKGNLLGSSKFPGMKAKARSSVRSNGRSWRWEMEAEGNAGVFEGVLCDGSTGAEIATWKPVVGGGVDPRSGMRRRYSGPGRAFSKAGGVVVAGDEMAEGVSWRVGREMEGRVLRWRVGGRVWVSYFPNEVKTGYFETRCVEWRDEAVELHLVGGG